MRWRTIFRYRPWQAFGIYSVLKALKDPMVFQQAHIEDGVVTWPGDIDLKGEWVLRFHESEIRLYQRFPSLVLVDQHPLLWHQR